MGEISTDETIERLRASVAAMVIDPEIDFSFILMPETDHLTLEDKKNFLLEGLAIMMAWSAGVIEDLMDHGNCTVQDLVNSIGNHSQDA